MAKLQAKVNFSFEENHANLWQIAPITTHH
jgi:hypothetical protein